MINWKKIDRENLPDGTVLCKTQSGRLGIGFLDIDDDGEVCCIGEDTTITGAVLFARIANVPTPEQIKSAKKEAVCAAKDSHAHIPTFIDAWEVAAAFFQNLKID